MEEVFNKIGVPEVLYHDNEGSWSSTEFIRLINSHQIKQIITSTPPPFAERIVQTITHMKHSRLDGLEKYVEKWVDMLPSVLNKYNNTKHSTTGMQPNEAVKPSNHMEVWLNICSKTTYNRRYPPIKVSDKVRVYQKPKSPTSYIRAHVGTGRGGGDRGTILNSLPIRARIQGHCAPRRSARLLPSLSPPSP